MSTNSFTFYHNTSNNSSDFKGYELYYRCYYDLGKAEYDRQAIEALAASSSAAPDSVLYSMTNLYKFSRMFDSFQSAGDTPLLGFSSNSLKGGSVQYVVSIPHPSTTTLPAWTVLATYGYNNSTATISLYRSAYTSTSHKGFVPWPTDTNQTGAEANFIAVASQDADYDGASYGSGYVTGTGTGANDANYNTSTPLYMVVFAVGVGLPQDNLNTIPSLPASFGATMQIRP